MTLVAEATESKGATLLNWSDFLLQKLYSYGEALNLREAMAPPISTAYNGPPISTAYNGPPISTAYNAPLFPLPIMILYHYVIL